MNNGEQFFNTSGAGGYAIERSLRFNSSDSAYLSRTATATGSRRKFTWSYWIKLSGLGGTRAIWSTNDDRPWGGFYLDGFWWNLGSGDIVLNAYSDPALRDPSAWYHFVVAVDTDQAVSTDRFKVYINGVYYQASGVLPSLNADLDINRAGDVFKISGLYSIDAYLADFQYVDGEQLTSADFGEFDDNGIWQPIEYTGTYGTNGFHLDFADNSTAAALGTDSSGNGNTWTVNNISPVSNPQAQTFSGFFWTQYKSTYNDNTIAQTKTGSKYRIPLDDLFSGVADGTSYSASQLFGITKFNSQGYIHDSLTSTDGTATTGFANSSYTGSFWKGYFNYPANSGKYASITVYDGSDSDGTDYAVNRSGCDSLVDVPTNGTATDTGVGGEVRGNYCTLNPLNANSLLTLSNGNLDLTCTTTSHVRTQSTIGISTGKWYWESTVTLSINSHVSLGIALASSDNSTVVGNNAGSWGIQGNGNIFADGSYVTTVSAFSSGDVIGLAFDADAGTFAIYKNGSSIYSSFSGLTNGPYFPAFACRSTAFHSANFGQRPFAYTAPSGFKALSTTNLPAPTIEDGSTAMDVALYTGNGSTNTISGLNLSPDLVWIKTRSAAVSHALQDIVRGTNKVLYSNSTGTEDTYTDALTSFNSDGFTLGAQSLVNNNTSTYVAWAWDAGSSTVSNDAGSIASQVRANASAGFSIVTYTGTGANATVGHGLGVAPQMIIVKSRGSVTNWGVGHTSIGWANALRLNTTDASSAQATFWNSTAPTSAVFSVGTGPSTNNNGDSIVAYCFAPVAGYSSFGSYTGNGSSTDGPFIWTGHRSRWIMVKRTNASGSWWIWDAMRDPYNVADSVLRANNAAAENVYGALTDIDITSNGFKFRGNGDDVNASGSTYVWAAFAESPFQYARAR